jgi:RNA polymerase primary sigma factor
MRQLKISQQITTRDTQSLSKYFSEISSIPMISAEEEVRLARLAKTGDDSAIKTLANANLRFVVSVAKQYQFSGELLSDLISAGNIGVLEAARRFDETKGFKFISYAVWWIRQSILQSLNENARTIRLPVNVVQELQKEKKLIDSKGGELSAKFAYLPNVINLESQVNEDGDTLIDFIPNENSEAPDATFNTKEVLKEKLMTMLSILDERERAIVEDYFGLTGTSRTLEDIGNDFNLTKERVRQIKEKALRKLRNECSVLFDYM